MDSINGTPLHPLVIHAAVLFTPLAAIAVILFVVVRRWRAWLRVPALVLAVVAALAIGAAYLTGDAFFGSKDIYAQNPLVLDHKEHAQQLLWVGIAFAVVSVLAVLLTRPEPRPGDAEAGSARTSAVGVALGVLAVLLALATLVLVAIVGDLGARAVWGGNGLF